MAVLISRATGNFTTSTTWGVVDSTSYNNTETTTTALSTSFQESTGATTGVITCDGIALKLAVRTGTTGTMSVHLAIATVEVTGTLVTINTADLPAAVTANADGGWIFFKFASPVTLVGATSYTVGAKTSSSSQISLRSTATTNWARALSTTTNAAPSAGDDLIIAGEYVSAGSSNALTVTMNNTATTDFGSNTTSTVTPALALCSKGVLTWGTTASTNYYLKLSGYFIQYLDSTYNMGTTGTPMPSTSTGVLEFDPGADGDFGLVIRGGTSNMQGASKTLKTTLTADVAAAGTTLTIGSTTGWLATDVLGIASTTQTASECESKIIQTVDSATGVTLTAGVTNAHSGTSPIAGEVINTTCNLKIRSATSTLMTFITVGGTATTAPTLDWDYVEMYYMGVNTAGKRGLEVTIATTSAVINNCSIHDTEIAGLYFATSGTPTFDGLVFYNLNTTTANLAIISIGTGATLSNSTGILFNTNAGSASAIVVASAAASVTNCTIVGCSTTNGGNAGFLISANAIQTGTFSGNISHSNNTRGFVCNAGSSARYTLTSCTAWRNASAVAGFDLGQNASLTLVSCTAFGNAGPGFGGSTSTTANTGNITLRSCTAYGGTTLVQPTGLNVTNGSSSCGPIYVFDSTFGSPSGHSTADIASGMPRIYLFNTTLASTTEATTPALDYVSIQSHKNDASSTTFKAWQRFGTIQNDTTTRHTASGYSWKMTPNTANLKMILPGPTTFDTFKAAVNASSLVTITVYVQKDGSYNGNAPRLVLVGGIVASVGSAGTDVTASLTVGASTWEQLSVTATPSEAGVVEWYVDCDGTAGNIYVDDVSITQA